MNKNQATLAWWGVVLLSLVSVIAGFVLAMSATDYNRTKSGELVLGILLIGAVPIVLILGLAYIRSGQKKAPVVDVDSAPATMNALEAIPCPKCGTIIDARDHVRKALMKH